MECLLRQLVHLRAALVRIRRYSLGCGPGPTKTHAQCVEDDDPPKNTLNLICQAWHRSQRKRWWGRFLLKAGASLVRNRGARRGLGNRSTRNNILQQIDPSSLQTKPDHLRYHLYHNRYHQRHHLRSHCWLVPRLRALGQGSAENAGVLAHLSGSR